MGTIFPHNFQHHYRPIGKKCMVVDHSFGNFRCSVIPFMIQRKVAAELNFDFFVLCSGLKESIQYFPLSKLLWFVAKNKQKLFVFW